MKHPRWRPMVGVLAVTVLLAGARMAGGADDFKVEEGYTSLFNGKDLSGWRYGKKGDPLDGSAATADKRFTAGDGVLVAEVGRGTKDLYTVRSFDRDFHLKLEFRAAARADSGVYIRGPQLQVRDFLRRNEQKQLTKFKNDDWNELEITVTGTEAVCLVNGQMLQKMKVPAKGPIGLQAETGKFEFRRIRIKELP